MMERQSLQTVKGQLRRKEIKADPVVMQLLHTLIDSHLQCLNELEGGDSVIEQRNQLKERERQVGLGLAFVARWQRNAKAARARDEWVTARLADGIATLALSLVQEMIKATGTKWRREWSWYVPRIEEEFDFEPGQLTGDTPVLDN